MSVYSKLLDVQAELKAPKGQTNSFGNYKYRSCEDILEALKPVLKKHDATVHISDEITVCEDRFYVKATATFIDLETLADVSVSAFARESKEKRGMDDSQITGATSSYARKYALNGLFLIDDTKDADTDENKNEREKRAEKQAKNKSETSAKIPKDTPEEERANEEMRSNVDNRLLPNPNRSPEEREKNIKAELERTGQDEKKLLDNAGVKAWSELTDAKYVSLMEWLVKRPDKGKK